MGSLSEPLSPHKTGKSLSEKEFFGTLTDLLREIAGDPAIVAYTLRHGCLSNTFHTLLEPDGEYQHAFFRNGYLPREGIYALSTLGGHLDPDISLQSYIHTQDIVCHLYLRKQLRKLPIGLWAALEGRKEASLHQRRARNMGGASGVGEDAEFDQMQDSTEKLIKQLNPATPNARDGHKVRLPKFQADEPSLLDLDLETIHVLLFSLHRNHSAENRARLFSLPAWQIENFAATCDRLAKYRTKSTSGTRSFRNLKPAKDRDRLPDLYRRAQPGQLGPALPHHSRHEMREANRVYSLLARRANELNMDRALVTDRIIKPIRDVLLAYSGSEAVVRAVSAEQFANAIQAVRNLNIPPARIEIELEALPRADHPTLKEWIRQLEKIARTRKLRVNERCQSVTRRSQAHPEFGIVKIRVLALQNAEIGDFKRSSKAGVSDHAGAGWRVGCFYAIAALTALLWVKRSA